MKPETFFDNLQLLADAPNAIPKLRDLVLKSAVRGKLVVQDPLEASARQCLSHSNAGICEIEMQEISTLPFGWVSLPLGCLIASNTGGGTPSKQKAQYWDGAISWASVKDIPEEKYLVSTIDKIAEEGLKNSSSNLIPSGRLIVVTRMGLGKLAINKIDVAINQDLRAIEPISALDIDFAYILFKTFKLVGKGVTVKGITLKVLHSLIVSLPPLAEQKRIVARVDQLMALCDELEEKQKKRGESRIRLNRSCLHELISPEGDPEKSAWNRIRDNFNLLYDCPENVSELRKAILQLAVMGRLVPQNPNDEPASELLKKIKKEKEKLIKEGKIRKPKPLPPINHDEVPYELPQGWTWIRLDNIGYWASGSGFPKKEQGIKDKPILFCKVSDMNSDGNEKFIKETANTIDENIAKKIKAKIHNLGTVIFPKIGGAIATNKRRILTRPTAIDNNCLGIIPCDFCSSDWLYLLLNSIEFTKFQSGTSVPALSQRIIGLIITGLPPLAEQKRIVVQVDQLMALCDELEENLKQSQLSAECIFSITWGNVIARNEMTKQSHQATRRLLRRCAPRNDIFPGILRRYRGIPDCGGG